MPTALDHAFSALSDPTRRTILARLALGETTVMELAKPFAMSQPAISRHLRVLENAGLIVRRIDGARHPCRLAEDGLKEIDQWLEMLRSALSRNYDRLDTLLAQMSPKPSPSDPSLKTRSKEKIPDEQNDAEDRR